MIIHSRLIGGFEPYQQKIFPWYWMENPEQKNGTNF